MAIFEREPFLFWLDVIFRSWNRLRFWILFIATNVRFFQKRFIFLSHNNAVFFSEWDICENFQIKKKLALDVYYWRNLMVQ